MLYVKEGSVISQNPISYLRIPKDFGQGSEMNKEI